MPVISDPFTSPAPAAAPPPAPPPAQGGGIPMGTMVMELPPGAYPGGPAEGLGVPPAPPPPDSENMGGRTMIGDMSMLSAAAQASAMQMQGALAGRPPHMGGTMMGEPMPMMPPGMAPAPMVINVTMGGSNGPQTQHEMPMPQHHAYQQPYQPSYPQMAYTPPAAPKKTSTGLVVGIVAGVLVLGGGGGGFAYWKLHNKADADDAVVPLPSAQATSTATATAETTPSPPTATAAAPSAKASASASASASVKKPTYPVIPPPHGSSLPKAPTSTPTVRPAGSTHH